MKTLRERFAHLTKEEFIKLAKKRIAVAKRNNGKWEKRLNGTGTHRGIKIQKATGTVIDIYKERIEKNNKIIKMREQYILEF